MLTQMSLQPSCEESNIETGADWNCLVKRSVKQLISVLKMSMVVTAIVVSQAGCDVDDPMLKDMEAAWLEADRKGGGHEERAMAVTRVAQNYFPVGSKVEDIGPTLRCLHDRGYRIAEYQHDRAKQWPEGQWKPYISPSQHDRARRGKGIVEYSIRKQYGMTFPFITKHVAIRISTDGVRVLDVEGSIWKSGI